MKSLPECTSRHRECEYYTYCRSQSDIVKSNTKSTRFRYAACQLDILAECDSVREVERQCASLPRTLDETYERIIGRISSKHAHDAIRTLAMVLVSQETTGPISAQNLVSAVKVYKEGESFTTINALRRLCVCLIKVCADQTVILAHYTVREFLQSDRTGKTLPDFHLRTGKADEIFCNTVMLAASRFRHTTDSQLRNRREDRNGNPVDFSLYALAQTRSFMFWGRHIILRSRNYRLGIEAGNKELVMDLLNPYGPAFRALQLLGCDSHSDTANEEQFEWLVKFNTSADALERAAAHLTMLLSFQDQPELAQAFLSKVKDKAALFKTEMKVTFPAEWETYRKRGSVDARPTSVTVLSFYTEGHRRGFDTQAKLKAMHHNFGSYITANIPAHTTPAPSNSRTRPSPASYGTPPSVGKESGESSRGSGRSSYGRLSLNPNTSSQRRPQTQSHDQPQSHSQTLRPSKPQAHIQSGQGHANPQARAHTSQGQHSALNRNLQPSQEGGSSSRG